MASLPTSYTKCMIVNMRTRTAADLRCGSPQDGTRVQGHALLYGNPNQIWELVQEPEEHYYKIINLGTKTAMEVRNGSSDPGTLVEARHAFNTTKQIWKFVPVKKPGLPIYWMIINKASDTALDLALGNPNDDVDIVGWEIQENNDNQKWILLEVNS